MQTIVCQLKTKTTLFVVIPPQHYVSTVNTMYSKHPHIRTLILEVRLIRFLYIGCLVKNQPEGVLKLFLKIGGGNQNCNKYTKKKPEIKLAYLM